MDEIYLKKVSKLVRFKYFSRLYASNDRRILDRKNLISRTILDFT
jgi:hypothetical protein